MVQPLDPGLRPVELHILLAVAEEPLHGYGIIKAAEDVSRGAVQLEPGTLYRAIRRLVREQLVREASPPPTADSADPRRRYYRATAAGRRVLRAEMHTMMLLVDAVRARHMFPDAGGR